MEVPEARILVVDDEDLVRGFFEDALTAGGYEVDVVATAEQAYAMLDSGRYALVIADWWLDDGNGLSIVNDAAARGAKTFVASGYELQLLGDNAKRHGLLRKPVSPNELIAAVREAIGDPDGSLSPKPETLR
jgi:DNA-binding response OmpR family regulator